MNSGYTSAVGERSWGDVEYDPSISLELTDGEANQETNIIVNSVAFRTNNFKITAQDVTGYNVYVQAAYGYTGQLRGQSDPSNVIEGVDINTPPEAFRINTWGYSFVPVDGPDIIADPREQVYNSLPNNDDTRIPAYSSDLPDSEQNFTLAFAAKFGENLPADHYTTNVNLSVVAGAKYVSGFAGVQYMQDINSDLCKNVAVGETGRLIDERDKKVYWVAKLADGNCWMTQNLDLDLSTDKTLTPADTNIKRDWTPSANTIVGSVANWPSGTTARTATLSFDPGQYVYKTPTILNECKIGTGNDSQDYPKSLLSCGGDLYNWVNVSNLLPLTEELPQSENPIAVIGSSYDAHYLVGNYYNWYAATAGTASFGKDSVASSSICPRGWKLPIGGGGEIDCRDDPTKCTNADKSGSFRNLFSSYGISGMTTSGMKDGLKYDVRKAPLYFLTSGWAGTAYNNSYNNVLFDTGESGYYYSSVAATGSNNCYAGVTYCVWGLLFSNNGYMSDYTSYNGFGESIRCVAE